MHNGRVTENIKQLLSYRRPLKILDNSRLPSAVLVPIFKKDAEYHILFIQRSNAVGTHKGQIAFPGGTYELKDGDLLNTALREAEEEVNLRSADVEILGRLDDHLSHASNFVISPYVGLIPYPYDFKVDGRETEGLLEAAVPALADEGHLHRDSVRVDSHVVTSFYYHAGNRIVWGATARILYQFLKIFGQAQALVNT